MHPKHPTVAVYSIDWVIVKIRRTVLARVGGSEEGSGCDDEGPDAE